MDTALNILKYIISKFFNFMFTSYIFDGVSLGMIFIVCFVFGIMISTLLNTPSLNGKARSDISKKFNKEGDSNA